MTDSVLIDCVPRDHFGITCIRGLSLDEVLSRLEATDQAPYPLCTPDEALQRFGPGSEKPAVRVCLSGEWTILLDVDDHGELLQTPVLTRLSVGTEAVSVWHLMSGTTRIAHALGGKLLASYDDWKFESAQGADASRLNRALADVGFFLEENEESDEWDAPQMSLVALEREFGLALSQEMAQDRLPVVSLQHLQG